MKFLKLENNDELQANLFSFAIHLALFLVMVFSVGWQTKTPYYGEVELWDTVPVQKKINKTQASPKKKIKQKQNTKAQKSAEAKAKAKAQKEADIKLKKKKAAEKRAAEKKAKKLKKQKAIKELKKKVLKQEKIDKLKKEMLEKEKVERLQQQIIEQQKIEKMQAELRENELKQQKKPALEGENEVKGGVNTGELNKYKLLIQQKIQQNVNQQLCGLDYITLEFRISLMPTGDLLGQPKMTKSSKIKSCDDAVERAIIQSQPLPLPKDSGLFSKLKNLELKFHPNGVE
ncbi:cell envelope integrity protein TolA [Methylophilaceae bacterium]|jgi:colicin import membrane protein|nr:cell envelope integrity protein TolA [Methylophilaceae bacterium]